MPQVPGGIAPPAKPPTHAAQVEVSLAPNGGFGFFCPVCNAAGPTRDTQAEAEADKAQHLA